MPRACAVLLLAGIALASLARRPRAAVPPLSTCERPATAWGLPISPTVH